MSRATNSSAGPTIRVSGLTASGSPACPAYANIVWRAVLKVECDSAEVVLLLIVDFPYFRSVAKNAFLSIHAFGSSNALIASWSQSAFPATASC